jgi:hypothetical protein
MVDMIAEFKDVRRGVGKKEKKKAKGKKDGGKEGPERPVFALLRTNKELANELMAKLETFARENPIRCFEEEEAEKFVEQHTRFMEGFKKIVMDTVPTKERAKATATYRLNDAEFNKLWRARKVAYGIYRGMGRTTAIPLRHKEEARERYREATEAMLQGMKEARDRHFAKMSDDIMTAFRANLQADLFRAVKKMNGKSRVNIYEEDGTNGGELKKLDGTMTRTSQEAQERMTEHFKALFNQESDLVSYPNPPLEVPYCGFCKLTPAQECGDVGPASSMLQWERDAWEYADEDEQMREEYEREYNKEEGEEVGGSEEKAKEQPALKVPPDWALPPRRRPMAEFDEEYTMEEFTEAAKGVGLNRAVAADGVAIEVIKLAGGRELHRAMLALCNGALKCETCPPSWRDVTITAAHKGDDKTECTNYRGLSVMSHCGKLLERMILNRLRKITERNPGCIPDSQCGFVAGKSTVDALIISRIITAQSIEGDMKLLKAYIDLTKAYDKVHRETMWEILRRLGTPPRLLNLIISLHQGAMATVKMDGCGLGAPFELKTGLKQGSILSPMLFNIFLGAAINATHERRVYETDTGIPRTSTERSGNRVQHNSGGGGGKANGAVHREDKNIRNSLRR